jgi:hypothetical protein
MFFTFSYNVTTALATLKLVLIQLVGSAASAAGVFPAP